MDNLAAAITALETSGTEFTQQFEAAMATLTKQTTLLTAQTIKNINNMNQNWNGRGEKRRRFPPCDNNRRSSNFNNPRRRKEQSVSSGNLSEFNNKMSEMLFNLSKINTMVVKVVNPSPPNSKGDAQTTSTTVAEATAQEEARSHDKAFGPNSGSSK